MTTCDKGTLLGIYFLALLSALVASDNIETRKYITIKPATTPEKNGQVFHFGSTLALFNPRTGPTLYVGAPGYEKSGRVFNCSLDIPEIDKSDITCTNTLSFRKTGAIGLTMQGNKNDDSLLVCGNQYTLKCGENDTRMVGACYKYDVMRDSTAPLDSPCPTTCPFRLVADIVFALDESGSVSDSQFISQLDWVNNLLQSFRSEIDSGDVRVGIIVFNSNTRDAILLRTHTFDALTSEITRITNRGGGTQIVPAIRACVDLLERYGRKRVAKEMIVLTDGGSSGNITGEANSARSKGITTVAVGVGSGASTSVLNAIAGDPSRLFTATDFSNLDEVTNDLRNVIRDSAGTVLEGQSTNSSNNLTQCQEGSSAHISEEGNIYVGLLGSYDRSGSVAEYKKNESLEDYFGFHSFLNERALKELFLQTNVSALKESYLGYSLTTGRFLSKASDDVASGAPRYQSKGAVIIYNSNQPLGVSLSTSHMLYPLEHALWQLGAYFGHTLCRIDLNKDSLDDLLVSAPLFSDNSGSYDQGRVFVFRNNPGRPGIQEWMSLGFQPQVIKGSNAVAARFGMSVVVGGDVDLNGYDDIMIGAPGEEASSSGSGAVYIYYGSKDGISESNKQRILGKRVRSNLVGFGSGLLHSEGSSNDLDGNRYPDIVVSAPGSDDVVVLFSRPIVDVTATIVTAPSSIHVVNCFSTTNRTCSTFEVCVSASPRESHAVTSYPMDFRIELDALVRDKASKRLLFYRETESTKSLSRILSGSTCFTYDVTLNINAFNDFDAADIYDVPLRVQVHYNFTPTHAATTLSAVFDPSVQQYISSDWVLYTGCTGKNGSCSYDLSVSAQFLFPEETSPSSVQSPPYIFKTVNPGVLAVNVHVRNVGQEYSLYSRMNISSGPLTLSQVNGSCSNLVSSTNGLTQLSFKVSTISQLNGYFTPGQTCVFTLYYELQSLTNNANVSNIEIRGKIFSTDSKSFGSDENPTDNSFMLSRQVRYRVRLTVSGTSSISRIFYNHTTSPVVANSLFDSILGGPQTNFLHSHTIYHAGVHVLSSTSMSITWPASLSANKTLPLFYLYDFQCNPTAICQCDTNGKVNTLGLSFDNKTTSNISLIFPSPSSVNLPAQTSCSDVFCDEIKCNIVKISQFDTVSVSLRFKLWLPTLSQPLLSTVVSSNVRVDLSESHLIDNGINYNSAVSTTVSAYVPPVTSTNNDGVPTWIYIVAIVSGLALIAAIAAGLWKAGFFKSKYADLKNEAMAEEEEANSPPKATDHAAVTATT